MAEEAWIIYVAFAIVKVSAFNFCMNFYSVKHLWRKKRWKDY